MTAEQYRYPYLDSEDTEILRFFEHDYIDVISVDRMIGEQAHLFCRKYALSPADGIHVAYALRGNCDILLSWDDALNAVSHPQMRCAEPRMLGQLNLDMERDSE